MTVFVLHRFLYILLLLGSDHYFLPKLEVKMRNLLYIACLIDCMCAWKKAVFNFFNHKLVVHSNMDVAIKPCALQTYRPQVFLI